MHHEVTIQEDPETGEAVIELPTEVLNKMGFVDGDKITWEVINDCVVIRKSNSSEV